MSNANLKESKSNKRIILDPPATSDSTPLAVHELIRQINALEATSLTLFGFGKTMKWLAKLSLDAGYPLQLADWRPQFLGYDCAGMQITALDRAAYESTDVIVLSADDVQATEEGIEYLQRNQMIAKPVLYSCDPSRSTLEFRDPFANILFRARQRAESMLAQDQLIELIQLVDNTSHLQGAIAEYGTLYGGTGAVFAEALRVFGKKPLYLFDTFQGIPKALNGLDQRWDASFAGNSEKEVRDNFSDLDFVNIISGDILHTYPETPKSLSLAYIASDTFATGHALLPFLWSRLQIHGVLVVCDYRSYPNAIPLTSTVESFFRTKRDAFIYRPWRVGFWALKLSDSQ